MIKLRHIFLTISSLGSALFLGGCKLVVLNPKGVIAADEKQLLIDAVLLMLIIVAPVIVLTLLIARRYRASNLKAKYSPNWAHGTLLEAGWWLIPIIIISVLATMTWRSAHNLDPYKPLDSKVKPITIQVVALQWRWLFIYPDQKIATINYVEFPVDTPVTFLITSDAPMNSFQIPALAGQIYAMAGMQTQLHLMANEIGDYNGRSVSFSGNGFANMEFIARASSPKEFTQWVASIKKSPHHLTEQAYDKLIPPTQDHGVEYFSSVKDGLFNDIIMKFMMPPMKHAKANAATQLHPQSL